jgi:hypothetical protein
LRRLLILIVVLAGLFVAADRVAVLFAERAVAERIQTREALPQRPQVSIGGFPFLTQAVSGDYRSIKVVIVGLRRDGLVLDRVALTLHGVHVPLSAVLHRSIGSVPIDSAAGTVSVGYADLNVDLHRVAVGYAGSPGSVRLRSLVVPVSGTATVRVSGDTVTAEVSRIGVAGVSLPVGGLGFTVALPSLPFGVRLTSVTAGPSGISVSATGTGLTLNGTAT